MGFTTIRTTSLLSYCLLVTILFPTSIYAQVDNPANQKRQGIQGPIGGTSSCTTDTANLNVSCDYISQTFSVVNPTPTGADAGLTSLGGASPTVVISPTQTSSDTVGTSSMEMPGMQQGDSQSTVVQDATMTTSTGGAALATQGGIAVGAALMAFAMV